MNEPLTFEKHVALIESGEYGRNPVELTKDNVLDFIIEAGKILDEQNVPTEDRWIKIPLTPYHRKKRIRKKWLHRRYPFMKGLRIEKKVWKTSGLSSPSSSSKSLTLSVPTQEA